MLKHGIRAYGDGPSLLFTTNRSIGKEKETIHLLLAFLILSKNFDIAWYLRSVINRAFSHKLEKFFCIERP
jgi:hypothetical protein